MPCELSHNFGSRERERGTRLYIHAEAAEDRGSQFNGSNDDRLDHLSWVSGTIEMTEEPLDLEVVQLMRHEAQWFGAMVDVCTVTFLESSTSVDLERVFRDRTRLIVEANPWLVGHVRRSANKGLELCFPKDRGAAAQISMERCVLTEVTNAGPPGTTALLSPDMPYEELMRGVKSLRLKAGRAVVGKPEEPLFRVCLLSAEPPQTFVLVVSVHHGISDGCNYYKILNQLAQGSPIVALNTARHGDYELRGDNVRALFGQRESMIPFGTGNQINLLVCSFMCSRTKAYPFRVDNTRLQARKDEVKAAGKVPYVSTNDILISEIGLHFQPDVLAMAVDLRQRFDGLDDDRAGNYVGFLYYLGVQDYASPEAVRMSLTDMHRAGHRSDETLRETQPPTCMSLAKCAMITNWSSFAQDLDWGDGVEQLAHFPIEIAPWEGGIIFRARQGETGVLVFAKRPPEFHHGSILEPAF